MIFVTGGAGFIASNFVLHRISECGTPVVNLYKLTYTENLHNLDSLNSDPRHIFVHGDIVDRECVRRVLRTHQSVAIVHFAADTMESSDYE